MRDTQVRPGSLDLPLVVSSRERGFRFHLGKIKGAGAWPNIVEQACDSHFGTFVVEDAQRPASQLAPGRAFDADREPETFARRYCGWQAPDVHARRVRPRCEGELGRGLFMQNPVLLLGSKHGPVAMLAHFKRRPQYERARDVRLAVERREFDTRQLGVVLISDPDALSPQVASVRAGDPGGHGQFGPG